MEKTKKTAAADTLATAIARAVRPDPAVLVDQWAEANRILPPDTPEPGPYRSSRTPYLIDIQRAMSPGSPWREGWFQKGHQIGGSVSGENMIGAWVSTAAGSLLVVFPTIDDAKQWEISRFEPMRSGTAALRRRIRPANEKGADNTKLRKRYPGGVMRLVGSNRVGALKSATIRYVKFEEPDEYPPDLADQGNPIALAKARTANFGRKAKIYGDGTPTIEGASAIATQFARGDQRRWHLVCPDCAHPQHLRWEQLKWTDADPATARYACEECGTLNAEAAWKARNYATRPKACTEEAAATAGLAHWVATATGEPGVASWHINALAAPIGWRPWPGLVQEWLAAQGNEEALKTFYNNNLGQPYALKLGTEVGAEALQQRAERYPLMTVPAGGLVLVAGVDTQDNRLAIVIRAFGRGEESWGVWHGEIYGDTSQPEVWGKLRDLLDAPVRHANGQVMRIDAAGIDSGGHRTEDVYAFCRDAKLRGRNWFAIKGARAYDSPKLGRPRAVEFTWRGVAVPGGVELRHVGTQAIKNLIDGRLKLTKPGGGMYHFPLGFEADYYRQLRAERRQRKRDSAGRSWLWWVKGTERNEAWDCEVYAYAALLYAISGQHADQVWAKREQLFGRVQQIDLLDPDATIVAAIQAKTAQPVADAPPSDELPFEDLTNAPTLDAALKRRRVPPRPRRGGFVMGWR